MFHAHVLISKERYARRVLKTQKSLRRTLQKPQKSHWQTMQMVLSMQPRMPMQSATSSGDTGQAVWTNGTNMPSLLELDTSRRAEETRGTQASWTPAWMRIGMRQWHPLPVKLQSAAWNSCGRDNDQRQPIHCFTGTTSITEASSVAAQQCQPAHRYPWIR